MTKWYGTFSQQPPKRYISGQAEILLHRKNIWSVEIPAKIRFFMWERFYQVQSLRKPKFIRLKRKRTLHAIYMELWQRRVIIFSMVSSPRQNMGKVFLGVSVFINSVKSHWIAGARDGGIKSGPLIRETGCRTYSHLLSCEKFGKKKTGEYSENRREWDGGQQG